MRLFVICGFFFGFCFFMSFIKSMTTTNKSKDREERTGRVHPIGIIDRLQKQNTKKKERHL